MKVAGFRRWIARLCGGGAIVVFVLALGIAGGFTAVGWGLQAGGDLTPFRPTPGQDSISLPRGDVLLVQFLQALADATQVTVYYKGKDSPGTNITLERSLDALDAKTAARILEANGFELSDTELKGKIVHWVQRAMMLPRQKGKIVRGEEKKGDGDEPSRDPPAKGSSAEREGALTQDAPVISLYAREEGTGTRFAVIFETGSRKEAEEALSLLKAQRRARTGEKQER